MKLAHLLATATLIFLVFAKTTFRWIDANASPYALDVSPDLTGLVAKLVISAAVLGSGLYVILSRQYPDDDKKWAYGVVGAIVGFWLG